MKKSYRDLYPNEEEMKRMPPPPKGVIGVTPAVVGSIEATEVLKIICGFGDILAGKLNLAERNETNCSYHPYLLR